MKPSLISTITARRGRLAPLSGLPPAEGELPTVGTFQPVGSSATPEPKVPTSCNVPTVGSSGLSAKEKPEENTPSAAALDAWQRAEESAFAPAPAISFSLAFRPASGELEIEGANDLRAAVHRAIKGELSAKLTLRF